MFQKNGWKKGVSTALAGCLTLGMLALPAGAAEASTEANAQKLNSLGLFQGTENGFELDRKPTRVEGTTMFVRLLGGEAEAKEKNYEHPFTDVPDWADPYVGYAWQYKLTTGVGGDKFDSDALISADQYTTFLLRALEYDDQAGDFSWDAAVTKAAEIGMLTQDQAAGLAAQGDATRGTMVDLSCAALLASPKSNSETKLVNVLVERNVIDRDKAVEAGLITADPAQTTPPTQTTAPDAVANQELLSEALAKFNAAKSMDVKAAVQLAMAVQAGAEKEEADINYEMAMSIFTDPLKVKATADLPNEDGTTVPMTIYLEEQENQLNLYISPDGTNWITIDLAGEGMLAQISGSDEDTDIDLGTLKSSAEETLNGVATVKFTLNLADEESGLNLPVNVWVNKETKAIEQFELDMQPMLQTLMPQLSEAIAQAVKASGEDVGTISIDVSKARVVMTFSNLDKATEFTVPEEARQGEKMNLEDLITNTEDANVTTGA